MKKSIVSILLAKAPSPDKLKGMPKDREPEEEAPEDSQDDGDESEAEGSDAAGESATGDFMAAIGHKNPVAAWKAFREMCDLCGDSGSDDDDRGY